MPDLIYLVLTFALFALVGLIAKGVEKLIPRTSGSVQSDAMDVEPRG